MTDYSLWYTSFEDVLTVTHDPTAHCSKASYSLYCTNNSLEHQLLSMGSLEIQLLSIAPTPLYNTNTLLAFAATA